MDWKTLIVALGGSAVLISLLMETIKRLAKRKTELSTWLQILIPFSLSALLSWVLWTSLSLPGTWEILIAYTLAVFLAQYYLSMEILKRIGGALARHILKSKGLSDKEIEEVINVNN